MHDGIHKWLESYASKNNIHARFHTDLERQDNGWLYIPVFIEDLKDPYDKVTLLQDMEDAFNYQDPAPKLKLLLIPAAN